MRINLSPVAVNEAPPLSLAVKGDLLIVNGATYELSELIARSAYTDENGQDIESTLPAEIISASEGSVTVRFPYVTPASEAVRFPAAIIDPPDGEVQLPS